MLIGVISDTHIPERAQEIPQEIFKIFKGVDLIIHAGDFTSLDVIKKLEKIAEVKAVCGNMDPAEICQKFPQKQLIKVGDFSIGVIHGRGHPDNLLDFVQKQFENSPDVIIFGHSHNPFNEKIGKTLFFNPGSPTDKFFASFNACGILKIDGGIEGKIIKLSGKNNNG